MILPQEHEYLSLSEEALLTQGFFVPEHFSLGATVDVYDAEVRPVVKRLYSS